MTVNADNARYFGQLKAQLRRQVAVGLRAGARAAYEAVLYRTRQDSGLAAYNWNVSLTGRGLQPFGGTYGQYPVGNKYEGRQPSPTAMQIVIGERLRDFDSRYKVPAFISKPEVVIYNQTSGLHAQRAMTEDAALLVGSNYPAFIEPAVEKALHGV